jgi:hypothetical protein
VKLNCFELVGKSGDSRSDDEPGDVADEPLELSPYCTGDRVFIPCPVIVRDTVWIRVE